MLEYIEYAALDGQLKEKAVLHGEKNKSKILRLAEKFAAGDNKCLVNQNDLTRLVVVIEALKYTKEKYERLNIDDEIFYETIKDIGIWCGNNDNRGLKNYRWIKNHIRAEIFKIGRLQFQLYKAENPTLKYNRLPFNYGENLVYIHIPQGEKLRLDDCISSIKRAKTFFAKHFPDYKFRYFFCESWLLYQGNINFMKENSNIIRFSALFEIAYSINGDFQTTQRVFGKKRFFKSDYPENTSLQKALKKHMLSGGKIGIGIGYIDALKAL